MKTIKTLITDIQKVLKQDLKESQWGKEHRDKVLEDTKSILDKRLTPQPPYKSSGGRLYMSNIGTPCQRKLYYQLHNYPKEELNGSSLLNFMYGDILESLVLELAKAAGHKVEGEQDTMYLNGLKGRRDAVIDGVLVDVKSASPSSFDKFKYKKLSLNDPFGYKVQLASYLLASREDPLVKDKNGAAFLVVNKVNGDMWLDYHDLRHEMSFLESLYFERKKLTTKSPVLPPRGYDDKPWGSSGNRVLGMDCSYCPFKKECWPGLRKFNYSKPGPQYLTKVVIEPRVEEDESW